MHPPISSFNRCVRNESIEDPLNLYAIRVVFGEYLAARGAENFSITVLAHFKLVIGAEDVEAAPACHLNQR